MLMVNEAERRAEPRPSDRPRLGALNDLPRLITGQTSDTRLITESFGSLALPIVHYGLASEAALQGRQPLTFRRNWEQKTGGCAVSIKLSVAIHESPFRSAGP